MPDKAHLLIYQGDDYSAVVTVASDNNLPPDLTGYTAKAQIRSGPADSNSAVIVEIVTSVQVDHVQLTIPRSVTVGLNKPQYSWDLQMTAPDGKVKTVLAYRCDRDAGNHEVGKHGSGFYGHLNSRRAGWSSRAGRSAG
jgi:hypothetical protein